VTAHTLDAKKVHYTWSSRHKPVLAISPGDSVVVETRDGLDGQLEGLDSSELNDTLEPIDFTRVAPLTGPIYVKGAQPGDIAAIKLLRLAPRGPGWTVIWADWCGFDYYRPTRVPAEARVQQFPADELKVGSSAKLGDAWIAVQPMLGIIGTAPALGEFTTLPPRAFGGNMDLRHVSRGSVVYLPVFVDGALISLGDGHAAQGDGEVCTTGIECAMDVEIAIGIERGRHIDEPELQTQDEYIVTAFGRDLDSAARSAMEYMHRHLMEVRGMSGYDAYMVMGLAGHLGINQVVDTPHLGARFSMPLKVIEH
jgi:acetamidase/formamidase